MNDFTDDELLNMIDLAYDTVFAKFSKKSKNRIIHYKKDSFAQRNICKIMEEQEQRLREMLCFIPLTLPVKMAYWLCDTREEIAELTDNEPINGLFWRS